MLDMFLFNDLDKVKDGENDTDCAIDAGSPCENVEDKADEGDVAENAEDGRSNNVDYDGDDKSYNIGGLKAERENFLDKIH